MATQAQFNALGAALDADVTALEAHLVAQDAQIAALQQQIADMLSNSMTAAEEDAVLVDFQLIAARVHALLP